MIACRKGTISKSVLPCKRASFGGTDSSPPSLPQAFCGQRGFTTGQATAGCPSWPENMPRTPYPAALLNFSFSRCGPLDKPRGARYAMHRHHPPGGCYDRVERPSDSIGSSLERAWCIGHTAQHRHATQTEVPLKQASCESRRTTKVSIPPARTPRPNGHPIKAHTRDLRKSADAASLGKRARDRSERMTSMVHWAHRQHRHAANAGIPQR